MLSCLRRCAAALLILLGFHAAPAFAQLATPQDNAVQHARPAMWVVKDADTTIYLFGTIHLLRPGMSWFEGDVRKAFDASSELVLEIADQDDAAGQARLVQRAMVPDGPTLSSQLPEPAREKLIALIAQDNVPLAVVDRMKPWFAALTLTALPLRRLGFDPASGAEATLRAAAQKAGKGVTGLETTEQQLGFFDGLSRDMQIALLVETIEEQTNLETTLNSMIGAWAAGDPVALAQSLNGEMDDNPALEKALLLDRNQHWADWIKARMDKPGTVFLAVGAGHLAGKGSVQDALAERRIRAERVEMR